MDLQYLLGLQGLRDSLSGALDGFFLLVSQLGKAELPMAVTLIVYWCFSRELGQRLLFTLNGSDLLNNVLKLGFCVYRPWVREPALHPVEKALSTATGYSFPSGHSSKAGAFFGGLALAGKKRRWVPWVCGAAILPGDVLPKLSGRPHPAGRTRRRGHGRAVRLSAGPSAALGG